MASKTLTSNSAPVVTGKGDDATTSFVATTVTGPDTNGNYTSEIVQYDDAKGGNPKTIGTRNPKTGEITWNDNASDTVKNNEKAFKKASDNQIDSIQQDLAKSAEEKDALNAAAGKGNQDNTDGNSDSSSAKATPAPRNQQGEFVGADVVSTNPRNFYTATPLCYPLAMRRELQDNIKINVIKHTPKVLAGMTFKNRPKGDTIGSVILPMPNAIADGNKTQWGSGTMTPAQIAAAGAVKAFLGDEKMGGTFEQIEKTVDQSAGNQKVSNAVKDYFTEQLTGAEDMLARTTGAIMNPNMELLFKGPDLRSFSFTWKMSPRDQRESIEIAKIIRMFKQSMAPQKSEEQLFLKAPNIYDLTLRAGKKSNNFLPKIKTCALTDCSVNYTPDGSFMAYDNDSMIAYEMTLSFQEIEPIYNNDMSSGWDNVGY